MDLFDYKRGTRPPAAPLAERMRPRSLDEFVGQEHLVGEGRLLETATAAGELPSLILWGPPGTGKTTLARILADKIGARFVALSAVTAGVKELREKIAEAEMHRESGARTVLFLDEIHRFNKAQQDALLPHVEKGTITLVGATTENPSFEVNSALLSRCRVVRLEALSDEAVATLVDRALADAERGLGKSQVVLDAAARVRLVEEAGGDARRALNALETAAGIARLVDGKRTILADTVAEALQKRALLYDRAGDEHYNVVSAFIKSLRGSDAGAATYWMARMLEAGEDPLFVCRRMVIFAAEDVGLADPRALQVAIAATEATKFVGLPEAVLPMTEAVLYLATAPKSNSALTSYGAAKALVEKHGALPVPLHLRNAPTSLMKGMGYGAGYRYPHDFDGNWVEETYLPDKIAGEEIYQAGQNGYEKLVDEKRQKR